MCYNAVNAKNFNYCNILVLGEHKDITCKSSYFESIPDNDEVEIAVVQAKAATWNKIHIRYAVKVVLRETARYKHNKSRLRSHAIVDVFTVIKTKFCGFTL